MNIKLFISSVVLFSMIIPILRLDAHGDEPHVGIKYSFENSKNFKIVMVDNSGTARIPTPVFRIDLNK